MCEAVSYRVIRVMVVISCRIIGFGEALKWIVDVVDDRFAVPRLRREV